MPRFTSSASSMFRVVEPDARARRRAKASCVRSAVPTAAHTTPIATCDARRACLGARSPSIISDPAVRSLLNVYRRLVRCCCRVLIETLEKLSSLRRSSTARRPGDRANVDIASRVAASVTGSMDSANRWTCAATDGRGLLQFSANYLPAWRQGSALNILPAI